MDNVFNVGDKVRIRYISDCHPHNNKIGTVSWLNTYKFYPNGDLSEVIMKTQGKISYENGTEEYVDNMYREGNGLVSPVEKVE